jgi:hypothetical protein
MKGVVRAPLCSTCAPKVRALQIGAGAAAAHPQTIAEADRILAVLCPACHDAAVMAARRFVRMREAN